MSLAFMPHTKTCITDKGNQCPNCGQSEPHLCTGNAYRLQPTQDILKSTLKDTSTPEWEIDNTLDMYISNQFCVFSIDRKRRLR